MAVADGNNTSASTWALIDSTSAVDNNSATITSTTSYVNTWTSFTPGAITVDGIAIKPQYRVSTTGTVSVQLYNATSSAAVAGTEVTLNMTDIPNSTAIALNVGWVFFKFASPVTLLAATAYIVQVKTSSSGAIVVWGSTLTNPSRLLRTTTTQAPTTGDDRFVMGEWTAAGTMTSRTVTLDDTANTDYGSSGINKDFGQALVICNGGTVQSAVAASTTYLQKISGTVAVYSGGVLTLGTTSSRMPTTSSLTVTMDSVSNVDFGLVVFWGGTFNAAGASKQRWTTLTADSAAGATTFTVGSTSGWQSSDSLYFFPTSTSATDVDIRTISTVNSSTSVTTSSGVTNARAGTGDLTCPVGNVTSNVKITGASSTQGTYITFLDGSTGTLDNINITNVGSGTGSKRGVEVQNVVSSGNAQQVTINSCAISTPSNTSGALFLFTGTSGYSTLVTFTNNFLYLAGSTAAAISNTTSVSSYQSSVSVSVTGNLIGNNASNGTGFSWAQATPSGAVVSNNRISSLNTAITLSNSYVDRMSVTFTNFTISAASTAVSCNSSGDKLVDSFNIINNSNGVTNAGGYVTFNSCNFYGNSTAGAAPTNAGSAIVQMFFTNCNFRGRTSYAQPVGLSIGVNAASPLIVCTNCTFGQTTAHTTADVGSSSPTITGQIIFNNCIFYSTTEFATFTSAITDSGYIGVQRRDGNTNDHVTHVRQGIITNDTSIFRTASPSLRITPKSAVISARTYLFPFKVAVSSGQTCTPTVYVRESVVGDGTDYNGNRIKLYVKANGNLGISSDTLLATATISSEGAWEALSGTTSAVTDHGVLEFYVTCDGTTGWINIDDFSATVA